MKTSYYLVTAAVLTAAAVTVYAQSRPLPALPPVVIEPTAPAAPPQAAPLPVVPPPAAPLPVVPPPQPTPLPAPPPVVPVPLVVPVQPPASTPLPEVQPPPAAPLPVVPPPAPVTPVQPPVNPAPLPVVPPPASGSSFPPPSLTPPPVELVKPATPLIPTPPPVEPMKPVTPLPVVPPPIETVKPVAPVVPMPSVTKPTPLPVVPPPTFATPPVQEPLTKPATPVQPQLPTPTPVAEKPKGPARFLVTNDAKLVEGTITKTDEKYVVRRGALDQSYTKEQVQFVGHTKDDVYEYMLSRVEPKDAEGRLKLARWCMFNGMRAQALTESKAVVQLQPANATASSMARSLEESLLKFPEAGTPAKPEVPAQIPPAAQDAEPDVTPEAALAFPTKAQALLVNLCADCHAKATYAGAFKLAPTITYDNSPATVRKNLQAVALQLKKDDPANSPLLVKAKSAHGGMKESPISPKQIAAYRNLEAWVMLAIGTDVASARPAVVVPPPAAPVAAPRAPVVAEQPPLPPVGNFGADVKPEPPPSGPSPTNPGPAVDEFDPSQFNKAVHPAKPK